MKDSHAAEPMGAVPAIRPLCVDLDGTLVKSDTLVDSLLVLVRKHPKAVLGLPAVLLQGKAAFKSFVTSHVSLDVAHLPWNAPLLDFLKHQHSSGRPIYLATGADSALANRVADHLHLFSGVLASDGRTNLTGDQKLASLKQQFPQGFDYIGNATVDLPMLRASVAPMVANPDSSLTRALRRENIAPAQVFLDRAPTAKALVKALRWHQWAKNVLLFLPLLLAHQLGLAHIATAVSAFICFGLSASATYILNDLLDIEADRRHPRKRFRAFAAANLSPAAGVLISISFLIASLAGAFLLSTAFLHWLLLYLVLTVSYSFYFKRIASIDVILLAGLYTLRILAGGAATGIQISPWLAAFSIFFFLSLAMVKRFSELHNTRERGQVPSNGRGYRLNDIEQLRSAGTASAYASIVVFALYINGSAVTQFYRHPARMWLITPLLILWVSHVWLLAGRGELDEDPVIFALTDKMSLLIGLGVALLALSAVF